MAGWKNGCGGAGENWILRVRATKNLFFGVFTFALMDGFGLVGDVI